jgi:hypothetical protein
VEIFGGKVGWSGFGLFIKKKATTTFFFKYLCNNKNYFSQNVKNIFFSHKKISKNIFFCLTPKSKTISLFLESARVDRVFLGYETP